MRQPHRIGCQPAQIHIILQPGRVPVDHRLIALPLHVLTEGIGNAGGLLCTQAPLVAALRHLQIEGYRIIDIVTFQRPDHISRLFHGFLRVRRHRIEIDAHFQSRLFRTGEVSAEIRVLIDPAGGGSPVSHADKGKFHTGRCHLIPVDFPLVRGNIDAHFRNVPGIPIIPKTISEIERFALIGILPDRLFRIRSVIAVLHTGPERPEKQQHQKKCNPAPEPPVLEQQSEEMPDGRCPPVSPPCRFSISMIQIPFR